MLVLFTAIFVAIIYRWISLERLQRLAPTEALASPTPEPTVSTKPLAIGSGRFDTARLFNGITVHATVETPPGSDAMV